jgi:hypothetical protein
MGAARSNDGLAALLMLLVLAREIIRTPGDIALQTALVESRQKFQSPLSWKNKPKSSTTAGKTTPSRRDLSVKFGFSDGWERILPRLADEPG